MRSLTNVEKGYIAGIVDGEGWIGLVNRTDRRNKDNINCQAYLMIGSTDKRLLDYLVKVTGLGHISKKYYAKDNKYAQNRKPSWLLRFSPNSMRDLLPLIIPYLIIKRRQAEIALEYLKMTKQGCHRSNEDRIKISKLYNEIKALNKKGRA